MSRSKIVYYWLLLGCFMVFMQIIIGGVTRLTGSGLSITKWEIVVGTLPPLNEDAWNEAFEAYRQTPQFNLINQDMVLGDFKFIYFWEWIHRFWARWMGFVFLIPFIFFITKKWIDRSLIVKLGVVFLWAMVIATFGWIMVASGLINKPYVSPLKLSFHLSLAAGLFAYLVWLSTWVNRRYHYVSSSMPNGKNLLLVILIIAGIQVFLGGVFSGMKAGLAYPTWPDMNGEWIPSALSEGGGLNGFLYYEAQDFYGRTLIQFIHRLTGYTLFVLSWVYYFKYRSATNDRLFQRGILALPVMVSVQALLGIITLFNCVGKIPVFWGVMHQGGAMLVLAVLAFLWYHYRIKSQI